MMSRDSAVSKALAKGYTMQELRSMPWDAFLEVTGAEPRTIKVVQNGRSYACLDVPYWDPEKKKATHRRKTIGYYDDDGRMIPTGSEDDTRVRTRPKPERYLESSEIGRFLLFDAISRRIGLSETVATVFGDLSPAIMTCVYYMAGTDDPLSYCEQWSRDSVTPFGGKLGDQRISELLPLLDENGRGRFFNLWGYKLGEDDNFALDITSISSYATAIRQLRAGYNRDGEDLEQINLALLIGTGSRLPVYYSVIPGNINDVSTMKGFIHTVRALGFNRFSVVTDKGFYPQSNIDELYRMRQRFLVGVGNGVQWACEAIDSVRDSIEVFDNFLSYGSTEVYCRTVTRKWVTDGSNHRMYVHVFYNPQKRKDDINHFAEELNDLRNRILNGDEAAAASSKAVKYLRVRRRGGKVTVTGRQDEIDAKNINSGFLVLASNHIKDPREAYRVYREKEAAENGFDDLKNEMDFRRLRIHSEAALEGKAFIAFLALIIKSEMTNVANATFTLRNRTRVEIVREMSMLRKSRIGDGSIVYSERTALQKDIIRAFGINAPFKDVVKE